MKRKYNKDYNLFKDLVLSYVKTNSENDFLKIQEVFEENENFKRMIISDMEQYPYFIKAFKASEQINIINDLFKKMIAKESIKPNIVIHVLECVSDDVLDVVLKNADNIVLTKLVYCIDNTFSDHNQLKEIIKNLVYDGWAVTRLLSLKYKIEKYYK